MTTENCPSQQFWCDLDCNGECVLNNCPSSSGEIVFYGNEDDFVLDFAVSPFLADFRDTCGEPCSV